MCIFSSSKINQGSNNFSRFFPREVFRKPQRVSLQATGAFVSGEAGKRSRSDMSGPGSDITCARQWIRSEDQFPRSRDPVREPQLTTRHRASLRQKQTIPSSRAFSFRFSFPSFCVHCRSPRFLSVSRRVYSSHRAGNLHLLARFQSKVNSPHWQKKPLGFGVQAFKQINKEKYS